jgi:hypothetical protein
MNVAPRIRARTLGQVHVPTVTLAHGKAPAQTY